MYEFMKKFHTILLAGTFNLVLMYISLTKLIVAMSRNGPPTHPPLLNLNFPYWIRCLSNNQNFYRIDRIKELNILYQFRPCLACHFYSIKLTFIASIMAY